MAERRSDAQVAREFVISLPHELNRAQQIALLRTFVNDNFTARGMVADVALHSPPRGGDERNWHAHVLTATRTVEAGGLAATKDRTWNSREQLVEWRAAWAEHANDALERAGFDERIDHRSYADQGIDKEPTRHEGPTVTGMRREGRADQSEVARDNDQRRARNRFREFLREAWENVSGQIRRLRAMLGLAPPVEDYLEAKAQEEALRAREEIEAAQKAEAQRRLEALREWHLEKRRTAEDRTGPAEGRDTGRPETAREPESARTPEDLREPPEAYRETPEASQERAADEARRRAAEQRRERQSEPERGDRRQDDKDKAATDSREARREEPGDRAESRTQDRAEPESPKHRERSNRKRRRREREDRGRDGRGGRDDDDDRGL